MKKILLTLILLLVTATNVYAAKIPVEIKSIVKKDFATTNFRFDGLITLPDGTLYLPLYPALVKKPKKIELKSTYPENKKIIDKPDAIIFNNDFVLLKILVDIKGRKTVLNLPNPPIEVRTGLLPQDLLVPSGLVIPDNIKGIMGNLKIETAKDAGLRINAEPYLEHRTIKTTTTAKDLVSSIPQLQNKSMYIITCYSKNIHVVMGEAKTPSYALAEAATPYDIDSTPDDKFILITAYGKTFVNVISLADERVIRQIELGTPAEEIIVDNVHNKAYISSSDASLIYIIDLNSMKLKQKIKIKGSCEKLYLTKDGGKLFYADKNTNDAWVVELDNDFVIKNLGNFPNISKIVFNQNKIYITSRTKNRLAVVDYVTLGLIKEVEIASKPVDMFVYKDNVYVLSAQNNIIQVVDSVKDEITDSISLNTGGFSIKFVPIKNTNLVLVMDVKAGKYSVFDLVKKQVIKTNVLELPVSNAVIVEKIRKIDGGK